MDSFKDKISKASVPVSVDLSNDSKSIIFETDQRKMSPFMSRKNIYILPKIMPHITPWTLILMLHIRQSIYLVQMFYLLHFWFSTYLMKSAQRCLYNSGIKVDILDTCGTMICSYFAIAFPLFFIKIENAIYTSCQNSTLLFINGVIFETSWTLKIT